MSPSKRVPYTAIAKGTFMEMTDMRLSPMAKLVRFYLLTCEHSKQSGYFRLPKSYVSGDVGVDDPTVEEALAELETAGLAQYDAEYGFVAIPDYYRHDPVGSYKNGRAVLSAWNCLVTARGRPDIKAAAMTRSAEAVLASTAHHPVGGSDEMEAVRQDAQELLCTAAALQDARNEASEGGSDGASEAPRIPHPHPQGQPQPIPTATATQIHPEAEPVRPRPTTPQLDMLKQVAAERGLNLDRVIATMGIKTLTTAQVKQVLTDLKSGEAALRIAASETESRNLIVESCRRVFLEYGAEAAREWAREQDSDLANGLLCNIQSWMMEDGQERMKGDD